MRANPDWDKQTAPTPVDQIKALESTLDRMRVALLDAQGDGFNVSSWPEVFENLSLGSWMFPSHPPTREQAFLASHAIQCTRGHTYYE